MLQTIVIALLVLWALGYLGGFVSDPLVHLLLIIALIVFIVRMVTGRRTA